MVFSPSTTTNHQLYFMQNWKNDDNDGAQSNIQKCKSKNNDPT